MPAAPDHFSGPIENESAYIFSAGTVKPATTSPGASASWAALMRRSSSSGMLSRVRARARRSRLAPVTAWVTRAARAPGTPAGTLIPPSSPAALSSATIAACTAGIAIRMAWASTVSVMASPPVP